jgi:autotransporter-associated beta strand protein
VNRNGSTYGTLEYFLGALAGGPDTQLRGSENTGAGNTYVIGDKGTDTTFAGTIRNGAGGSSAVVSLAKSGSGTLTLTGTNTYGGFTVISNGVLALAGNGSIANSTNIHLEIGAAVDASARVDGALQLGGEPRLVGRRHGARQCGVRRRALTGE